MWGRRDVGTSGRGDVGTLRRCDVATLRRCDVATLRSSHLYALPSSALECFQKLPFSPAFTPIAQIRYQATKIRI